MNGNPAECGLPDWYRELLMPPVRLRAPVNPQHRAFPLKRRIRDVLPNKGSFLGRLPKSDFGYASPAFRMPSRNFAIGTGV
jgi:hypothetical protein